MERYGSSTKISSEVKRKIDSDLLDLFVSSYQPFSLVEEKAFKKLRDGFRVINFQAVKPYHTLWCPISTTAKEKIKTEFTSSNIEKICLTADLWTSRINESYMAITGHYLTKYLKLKTLLLDCYHIECSHTSENIQHVLI